MAKKDSPYIVIDPIEHPGGWTIVPIHYSMDPEKSSEEWKAHVRGTYDREEDFNSEMELDFTAQLGAPAYPQFNEKLHVREKLRYTRNLPLCLCCDFNVDPCIFEVAQILGGRLLVIDEIVLSPGDIPGMVREFRNAYPDHPAGIHVYGDSNGLSRTSQTQKSDYELIQIHMQGYPSEVKIKVSRAHPPSRARINALNHRLRGFEGKPMIFISSACKELIIDLNEVVMKPNGKDVLKTYKSEDPYAKRTHASDALGYLVYREWPLATEVRRLASAKNKPRPPLKYGDMIGDIRRR